MNFRSLRPVRSCLSHQLSNRTIFTNYPLITKATTQRLRLRNSSQHVTNTNTLQRHTPYGTQTQTQRDTSNTTSQPQSSPMTVADLEGMSDSEYLLSKGKVPLFEDPTRLRHHLINDIGINLDIDWMDWKQVKLEFDKVLPYYINDFVTYIAARTSDPVIRNEILKRIQYMLYKTGIGGKNFRGILAINSLFHLKKFIAEQSSAAAVKQSSDESGESTKSSETSVTTTNRANTNDMSESELRFYNKYGLTLIDLHNALTVGCAIESLQSYFLVLDDVMDNSLTRRGQPCWFRHKNVGIKAINDAPIIESFVFWLISQRVMNFDSKHTIFPNFNNICHDHNFNFDIQFNDINQMKPTHMLLLDKIFQETKLQTLLGEAIDLELLTDASTMKEQYTMGRYESIVLFKTSFYTFYLPYASALYLAGYNDCAIVNGVNNDEQCKIFHIARQLSMEIGMQFQIQDDYLDCFGDPEITGKIGTDIQDFKCSWLVIQAMNECTEEQFENVLKKHYGKDDEESIEKVKQLYRDLNIPKLFEMNEEKYNQKITTLIEQSEKRLPKEMFDIIMKKLNKRKA